MGSLAADTRHPDASDRSLVLTHPTAAEKEQTWRLNHGEWGGPLDLPAYLQREPFLESTALGADGGMLHWILTQGHDGKGEQERSVLASCETIRKRVLYALPEDAGEVREGLSYGIGSVYTYPEFRGKKYANRMLGELGEVLKTWPEEEEKMRKKRAQAPRAVNGNGNGNANGHTNVHANGNENGHAKPQKAEAVCTALWSDIGKKFYATKGWPAFASEHVEFPSSSSSPSLSPGVSSLLERHSGEHSATSTMPALTLRPVTEANLAGLCAADEAHLRRDLSRHARETRRVAFAFAPDPDVFRWHWAREGFIAPHVFPGRKPSEVRGMIATVKTEGHHNSSHSSSSRETTTSRIGEEKGEEKEEEKTRMWAIWTRTYGADAATNPAKNTLYILRLVIDERPSSSPSSQNTNTNINDKKALQLAFDAIMHGALDAARAWHCGAVHLWNPTAEVRGLVAGSGLAHRFVDRQVDSIPSMMWFGPRDSRAAKEAQGGDVDVDWIANEKYCWC